MKLKKKKNNSKKIALKKEIKRANLKNLQDGDKELHITHHASITNVIQKALPKDGEGDLINDNSPEDIQDFFIEGYASTEDLDRGNDITHADAFSKSLKAYLKNNPIVLYNHDMDRPIGKVIEAAIEKGKGLFVKAFISATEEDIRKKILEGILKAFSFGYKVKKYQIEKPDNGMGYGIRHLLDVELLEISVVTIPMNQTALFSMAKAIELDTDLVYKNEVIDGLQRKIVELERKIGNGNSAGEEKSVVPFKSYPFADINSPWSFSATDGNRLLGDNGDDWESYKTVHAYYDENNQKVRLGYKLPHHKLDGDVIKTYPRGVFAAMAALLGSRGGIDIPEDERKGIYNHLAKHYKEMEKEPPQFKTYSDEELKAIEENGIVQDTEKNKNIEERKAGRVLSDANMSKLTNAVALIHQAIAAIDEIIAAANQSANPGMTGNAQKPKAIEINRIQIIKRVNN